MPYKDPEAQRAAQRRSYERNLPRIMAKQTAHRATEEGKAERRAERQRRKARIGGEARAIVARIGTATCYICGNPCVDERGQRGHIQCGFEPCAEIHVYGCTVPMQTLKKIYEGISAEDDELFGIALTTRYLIHVSEADPDARAHIRAEYQRLARHAFRCVARRYRR